MDECEQGIEWQVEVRMKDKLERPILRVMNTDVYKILGLESTWKKHMKFKRKGKILKIIDQEVVKQKEVHLEKWSTLITLETNRRAEPPSTSYQLLLTNV